MKRETRLAVLLGQEMTPETPWLPIESRIRDFPWLWVWSAFISSLAAGGIVLYLLWGKGVSDHQGAFDAAWKTAAGVIAILATFITVHRLRLSQAEHRLAEIADTFSQGDATERRNIDLFTKACDQLGSDKAPVRHAGFHALERLGQGNPNYRQTVVNVICAYLRSPFELPKANSRGQELVMDRESLLLGQRSEKAPGPADRLEELQVRQTAQQVLYEHLNPGEYTVTNHGRVIYEGPRPTFWRNVSVDLSDATLWKFNLSYCELENARFTGTRFFGTTSFSHAKVAGTADFGEAEFSSIPTFDNSDISRLSFGNAFARDMIPFFGDPIMPQGYELIPMKESSGKQIYYFSEVKNQPTTDKSG